VYLSVLFPMVLPDFPSSTCDRAFLSMEGSAPFFITGREGSSVFSPLQLDVYFHQLAVDPTRLAAAPSPDNFTFFPLFFHRQSRCFPHRTVLPVQKETDRPPSQCTIPPSIIGPPFRLEITRSLVSPRAFPFFAYPSPSRAYFLLF